MQIKLFVVLLVLLVCQCFCFADEKSEIGQRFTNKTLFVRGFYSDDKLQYDAQGNVEGNPKSGPWELGLIQIEHVSVKQNEFRLYGRRLASIYNKQDKKFVNVYPKEHESIDIEVKASADALSPRQLDEIAQKIFLSTLTYENVPDYWRDFFMGKAELPDRKPGDPLSGLEWNGKPVYRVSSDKTAIPPKLDKKRREPEYTEMARRQRLQGTTVIRAILDQQGSPEDLQVVTPLGMGLDDAAVQSVKTWRFTPAVIAGKPTAVIVEVEVSFNLYR